MTSEVQHVKSRCGGGKTKKTLEFLYPFITENPDETVIFSSKTKKLTTQSYEGFKKYLDQVSGHQLPLQRIDSDTVPHSSSVRKTLEATLDQKQGGVIFVSHAALKTVDPGKLRDVRLIIDEVPDSLVKHVRVSYEYKDGGSSWETLIKKEPCQGTDYQKVTLDDSATTEEVQRLIKNIRSGLDNSISKNVADLLQFLLAGHEVMYATSQLSNGKLVNYYLATDWQQLENLVTHSKRMAILSSQVHNTLVGFTIEKVMNTPIVETIVDPEVNLEDQHTAQAVIYPLVKAGRWSSSLKRKKATKGLTFNGDPVASQRTVRMYAQELALGILQGKPTLLTLNQNEEKHQAWEKYPHKEISSSAHGQNNHTDYHHAVFLSSKRPDKHEANALKLFAQHHKQCPEEIIQKVLIERCHETAYQCVARTSVRNLNTGSDTQHIFVVPDEAHAEYIASWFKPDMATIDRSYLHEIQKTTTAQERDKRMFNLIIAIRTEYLAGKGKLKALKEKHGLSPDQYKRYVKKFRAELEPTGILDRK